MEKLLKRQRVTKESIVHDISSTIRDISGTLASVNENYRALLKVNKAMVLYIQNSKNFPELTIDETENTSEETATEQE